MENQVDPNEQRFTDLQAQITQIQQLLTERLRPRRRQGRPVGRRFPLEEDDDDSDVSTVSHHSPARNHHHRRKLDMPIFKGDDAYNWLVRIERYFRLSGVRVTEKLDVAVIALEDKALNWFQWWEEQTPYRNWDEFKISLIRRFQPGILQNPLGPLLNLKQTGSVMDYREKFEMLVAPVRRDERNMLEAIFLNGLKEEIQAELKLYEDLDLSSLMDKALLLEEKNNALLRRGFGGKGEWRGEIGEALPSSKILVISMGEGRKVIKLVMKEVDRFKGKRLSPAELDERQKKGLCFKCGEKWNREHV